MTSEQQLVQQTSQYDQCVQNTYDQLRTNAEPDTLYDLGLYDQQTAIQMCEKYIEGFGYTGSDNFYRFIIILLVVAVVAYYMSTHKVKEYNLGLQSNGSTVMRPSVSGELRRILRR